MRSYLSTITHASEFLPPSLTRIANFIMIQFSVLLLRDYGSSNSRVHGSNLERRQLSGPACRFSCWDHNCAGRREEQEGNRGCERERTNSIRARNPQAHRTTTPHATPLCPSELGIRIGYPAQGSIRSDPECRRAPLGLALFLD